MEGFRFSRMLLALSLGLVLAFFGCGEDEEQGENGSDDPCADFACDEGEECQVDEDGEAVCVPVDEDENDEVECTTDDECDEEYQCVDGECIHACDVLNCRSGQQCRIEDGEAACYCIVDAGCDEYERCVDGECVPYEPGSCLTDRDCPEGEICSDGWCGGGFRADCTGDEDHCASGYACVGPHDDDAYYCLEPCSATGDCSDISFSCQEASVAGSQTYCMPNVCADNADDPALFELCDAAGTGDGTCIGVIDDEGETVGLCFAGGQAELYDECDTRAGHGSPESNCEQGLHCLSVYGSEVCMQLCHVSSDADPDIEPGCPDEQVCYDTVSDRQPDDPPTGVCMPET